MARLFDQVIGHKKMVEQLLAAVDAGRLSHTLLLVGPSGIGKTMVAQGLAQALVCEETSQACGRCPSCIRIGKGESEALLHVAPDGSQIKMDQAQEILRFLNLQAWGKARVIIIEDAHLLNVQAANALLKSLEEPPEKTFFILTALNAYGVLPTIRSRSQVSRFAPLDREEVRSLGGVEDWMVESCMGRLDVLAQLREPEVMERRQGALRLWAGLGEKPPMELARNSHEQAGDKESSVQLIQWWRQMLRDARFCQDQLEPLIHSDFRQPIERQSQLSAETLHWLHQELMELESGIRGNWDRQLAFENFFLRADELVRSSETR
ncbi:MAG: DNA polymerase III subunit [Bdellovibrionales bacterium]|nr:DNA polymerase III subunit [Bdellovibrionales bacterium]